jgi:hypothetical protein
MPDSTELDVEEAQQSTAKHRTAHSDGSSEPSVPGDRLTRWTTAAALLIALAALAVGVWAWHPWVRGPASPTAQQIADAKSGACTNYTTVRAAVSLQTRPHPEVDRVEAQALAANARLAMVAGSTQLLSRLDPATPPDLAELMRSVATDLQDLTINALAGAPDGDPGQVSRLTDVQTKSAKIVELCK